MEYTRSFSGLSSKDANIAGGKGASLGEMTQAGMPVPAGFVLLSYAFERFLKVTDLDVEIEAILESVNHQEMHSVEQAAEKIQGLILSATMPKDLKWDIEYKYQELGSRYVAVRSSATAEDGAEHAWAGQLESFLNTTSDNLIMNIQKCWASLFTPRAIFYRFEKGLRATHISVAVVIQKMVDSQKSGIAFSVHPVTENRNQLIIEAGFGLGEAIVSGSVTPDSYIVTKNPKEIMDVNVASQSRALYRADGGGSSWKDLGSEGEQQVLDKSQIQQLADLVIQIENHYGFPCDIEWAFENNTFYVTQSRPITTLSKKENVQLNSSDDAIVWEKVIQRNLPVLAWTGIAQNDNGIMVGNMSWVRGAEIVVKYRTIHYYVIQNGKQFYRTNLSDFLSAIDQNLETAIDQTNMEIAKIVESLPGTTLKDLYNLNNNHTKVCGLMVMAYDLVNEIKSAIDDKITQDLTEILSMPSQPTAIQREQTAISDAREAIDQNPDYKQEVLDQLSAQFGYLHQDYLGQPWNSKDYDEVLGRFMNPHLLKTDSLDLSKLSSYEQYLISLFRKFTYMYEEGRNAMVRTVWAMKSTSAYLGFDPDSLLYMTAQEIEGLADGSSAMISEELLESRKESFALYFNHGQYEEYSGIDEVEKLIQEQRLEYLWQASKHTETALKGQVAYKGYVKGPVRLVFTQADANNIKDGEILISPMTQVEFLSGIRKCAAIVTDEGGIICHAAIVSREFGKPCILGTQRATQVFKNGDLVEVDANNGFVKIIK